MPQCPQVKSAVDAGKSNPEGNVVTEEDLEVDQRFTEDFNRWYWKLQEEKEKRGKKLVSRGIGTSDSSINELFTRGSFRKYNDNYHKYVGNSSESVILGDETFRRSVGIQANVSDKNKVKHYYASDSDNKDVKRVKADAQGNSVMEKSNKFKKVKDDTSDAE